MSDIKEFIDKVNVLGFLPNDAPVYLEDQIRILSDLAPEEWIAKCRGMLRLTHQIKDHQVRDTLQTLLFFNPTFDHYWHERQIFELFGGWEGSNT